MDILSALGVLHEGINSELQKKLWDVDIKLSCGHVWLLTVVYQNGGTVEIRELVTVLKKKKTTISEMVATLEKRGLLEKFQSSRDKRIYCVKTTAKSEDLRIRIQATVKEIATNIMSDVSSDEEEVVGKIMMKMISNIK